MCCGFSNQVHGEMVLTQIMVTLCPINQPAFHGVGYLITLFTAACTGASHEPDQRKHSF